jgi:hypothetical protein
MGSTRDGMLPVNCQEQADMLLIHWAMDSFTTFQTSATYLNYENTLLKTKSIVAYYSLPILYKLKQTKCSERELIHPTLL